MRVVVVLSSPPHPEGRAAGKAAVALVRGLRAMGADVRAVAAGWPGTQGLVPPADLGVEVVAVPPELGGPSTWWPRLRRPRGQLAAGPFGERVRELAAQADVVFADEIDAVWCGLGVGVPSALHVHYLVRGDRPLGRPWTAAFRTAAEFALAERAAVRRYRHLLASSPVVADGLARMHGTAGQPGRFTAGRPTLADGTAGQPGRFTAGRETLADGATGQVGRSAPDRLDRPNDADGGRGRLTPDRQTRPNGTDAQPGRLRAATGGRRTKGATVHLIRMGLDPAAYGPDPAGLHEPVAGLLGTGTWPPTAAAAQRLAQLWPAIAAQAPGASLRIAGRGMASVVPGAEEVANAADFVRALGVVAFPLARGTGVKVKVLEALAAGVPVVTTPAGAEGIVANDGLVVVDNDGAFVDETAALLRDAAARRQRGAAGRAAAIEHHGPKAVGRAALDALTAVLEEDAAR